MGDPRGGSLPGRDGPRERHHFAVESAGKEPNFGDCLGDEGYNAVAEAGRYWLLIRTTQGTGMKLYLFGTFAVFRRRTRDTQTMIDWSGHDVPQILPVSQPFKGEVMVHRVDEQCSENVGSRRRI